MPLKKAALLIFILLSTLAGGFSQTSEIPLPVICHAGNTDAYVSILKASQNLRTSPGCQIDVTYQNVPATAQEAFEKAVQIWEHILISRVPIKIKVIWEQIQGSTLAYSGATRIYRNTKNAIYKDTWYVGPLAEALAGEDLNAGDFDINVTFNSRTNWSFSTDGTVFSGKYDLITVALHEIAHGLGISSSFKLINDDKEAIWGQSGFPYAYDLFLQNAGEIRLTTESTFTNPSAALKQEIESGNLFFHVALPPFSEDLPKLYTPSPFKSGGSISHLDESKYPAGSAQSLMLPAIPSASAIHDPGSLLLTLLNQIGWPVQGLESFQILSTGQQYPVMVYPNPIQEGHLNISFPGGSREASCTIELLDMQGTTLHQSIWNTVEQPVIELSLPALSPGTYVLRVSSSAGTFTRKLIKP